MKAKCKDLENKIKKNGHEKGLFIMIRNKSLVRPSFISNFVINFHWMDKRVKYCI